MDQRSHSVVEYQQVVYGTAPSRALLEAVPNAIVRVQEGRGLSFSAQVQQAVGYVVDGNTPDSPESPTKFAYDQGL